MAAKARSGSKGGRTKKAAPVAPGGPMPVLSIAVRSLLNMVAVVATSGSVLLLLFAAKRFV
jgi:hypothetical protein